MFAAMQDDLVDRSATARKTPSRPVFANRTEQLFGTIEVMRQLVVK
jgi:hypothetical protein